MWVFFSTMPENVRFIDSKIYICYSVFHWTVPYWRMLFPYGLVWVHTLESFAVNRLKLRFTSYSISRSGSGLHTGLLGKILRILYVSIYSNIKPYFSSNRIISRKNPICPTGFTKYNSNLTRKTGVVHQWVSFRQSCPSKSQPPIQVGAHLVIQEQHQCVFLCQILACI